MDGYWPWICVSQYIDAWSLFDGRNYTTILSYQIKTAIMIINNQRRNMTINEITNAVRVSVAHVCVVHVMCVLHMSEIILIESDIFGHILTIYWHEHMSKLNQQQECLLSPNYLFRLIFYLLTLKFLCVPSLFHYSLLCCLFFFIFRFLIDKYTHNRIYTLI